MSLSPAELIVFSSPAQAKAAGAVGEADLDQFHRIRPDAVPCGLVGDSPVWPTTAIEQLRTRKSWKRAGRRVRANSAPVRVVETESPPISLFALEQTISEEEYQEGQRERMVVTIHQWQQDWQHLLTKIAQWNNVLAKTDAPQAEEELRVLFMQRKKLQDRRLGFIPSVVILGMSCPEPDNDPWQEAVVNLRQRRLSALLEELQPHDHELGLEVDRGLIQEELDEAEQPPLTPYWKYYGRFHKSLETIRFQREAANATRIREFHALFPARAIKRHFTLFLGPTNSGKTYQALRRMAAAATGIYLAPLRLLALEVSETLKEWEIPCHMITGEERILDGSAQHIASTIEMLPLQKRFELCVIDEAQMLGDVDRGWAWTQAILGVMADEVCVIGAPESQPAIEKLLRLTGESWEVIHLERLSPLHMMPKLVRGFEELEPGTAIVAFSRAAVLSLKDEVERKTGHRAAVLYGALPPEVRRQQARLFASGDAPYLVATDAIGMGLNLPIKTILFAQDVKHIDHAEHPLTAMEVRQIAGRAGRFGKNELGLVGTFRIPINHIAKQIVVAPAKIERAHLAPNLDHLMALSELQRQKKQNLAHLFTLFSQVVRPDPEVYKLADLEDQTVLARIADRHHQLNIATRFALSAAPVPLRSIGAVAAFELMVASIARDRPIPLEAVLPDVAQRGGQRLSSLETAMRVVNLYCWLHYRFPKHFPDLKEAEGNRRTINIDINDLLTREKRLTSDCTQCGAPLPPQFSHPICDNCFQTRKRASGHHHARHAPQGRPHASHGARHHRGR